MALDGRIQKDYIILEVNGISLDQFNNNKEAIELLKHTVQNATNNEK